MDTHPPRRQYAGRGDRRTGMGPLRPLQLGSLKCLPVMVLQSPVPSRTVVAALSNSLSSACDGMVRTGQIQRGAACPCPLFPPPWSQRRARRQASPTITRRHPAWRCSTCRPRPDCRRPSVPLSSSCWTRGRSHPRGPAPASPIHCSGSDRDL